MLAVIISQIGHDWGYYVMITCLPKYVANVLQFSIRSNGLVTSLPFVAMFICTNLSGCLADWLIRTEKMKIGSQRKLFTFLGKSFAVDSRIPFAGDLLCHLATQSDISNKLKERMFILYKIRIVYYTRTYPSLPSMNAKPSARFQIKNLFSFIIYSCSWTRWTHCSCIVCWMW